MTRDELVREVADWIEGVGFPAKVSQWWGIEIDRIAERIADALLAAARCRTCLGKGTSDGSTNCVRCAGVGVEHERLAAGVARLKGTNA